MTQNNKISLIIKLSITGFILLIIALFYHSYNNLVDKEEKVLSSWSQVESNYQRRLDLIGNLVATVDKFASHESEVFEAVSKLRSQNIGSLKEVLKNANPDDEASLQNLQAKQSMISQALSKLIAVSERYPDLKSSENFLTLQAQIEGTENRINITRMMFNDNVRKFNAYKRKIPANIVSSIAGFKRKAYFKADKGANKKVNIK